MATKIILKRPNSTATIDSVEVVEDVTQVVAQVNLALKNGHPHIAFDSLDGKKISVDATRFKEAREV
jgi:hypothetical protein